MEKFFLAIDIGGTNTKMGLVSESRGLLDRKSVATEVTDGPARAVERWTEAAQEWTKRHKIAACGIGSPGPLERTTGVLHHSPNLPGWEDFSFTEAIGQRLGVPTFLEKDATAAAIGEWQHGLGKGCGDLVVITLGTGIGTGVISSGHVLRGGKGFAPEIGHMVIDFNGPLCNCGRRGCLEAYTGANATVARFREIDGTAPNAVSIGDIFDKAKGRDPKAVQVIDQWTKALAIGVGNIVNIFNPRKIILTGGVSSNWPFVEKDFQKILLQEAFEPSVKYVEVMKSKLGNDGALLGAAALAQTQI